MRFLRLVAFAAASLLAASGFARLPAPSDDAKAKAAEAAAKAAWGNKVADFQLCKSMEQTAARYHAAAKQAGKETKASVETPACADPGPFVAPAPAVPASAPKA